MSPAYVMSCGRPDGSHGRETLSSLFAFLRAGICVLWRLRGRTMTYNRRRGPGSLPGGSGRPRRRRKHLQRTRLRRRQRSSRSWPPEACSRACRQPPAAPGGWQTARQAAALMRTTARSRCSPPAKVRQTLSTSANIVSKHMFVCHTSAACQGKECKAHHRPLNPFGNSQAASCCVLNPVCLVCRQKRKPSTKRPPPLSAWRMRPAR